MTYGRYQTAIDVLTLTWDAYEQRIAKLREHEGWAVEELARIRNNIVAELEGKHEVGLAHIALVRAAHAPEPNGVETLSVIREDGRVVDVPYTLPADLDTLISTLSEIHELDLDRLAATLPDPQSPPDA